MSTAECRISKIKGLQELYQILKITESITKRWHKWTDPSSRKGGSLVWIVVMVLGNSTYEKYTLESPRLRGENRIKKNVV